MSKVSCIVAKIDKARDDIYIHVNKKHHCLNVMTCAKQDAILLYLGCAILLKSNFVKKEREEETRITRGLPCGIIRCDRETQLFALPMGREVRSVSHCLRCSVFQSLSPGFIFLRESLTFLNVAQRIY